MSEHDSDALLREILDRCRMIAVVGNKDGANDDAFKVPQYMQLQRYRHAPARCRTIAVVGIKDGANDDAFKVPHYMQQHGYRIVPVSPKLAEVLGERAVASLAAVRAPVDLIDLLHAPAQLP